MTRHLRKRVIPLYERVMVAACMTPDEVARYLASEAASITAGSTARAVGELEQHIDHCDACRGTIAATIRAGRKQAAPEQATAGERIGRYVVRAHRGTGAMGHVLEAVDPDLDREVAIKVLRHHGDRGDARALREGRALARLAHPNVVAVYDVGVWDGGVFLAMELVRGTTLRGWGAKARPVRDVVRVFAAVARGLEAAHAAGLVHRDIKPDNLVIGDDGRVRVIDFGLAISTANDATGELAGTLGYMAPEQRAGGEVGAAADQYAFMVSLREAIAREPRWVRACIERGLATEPGDRHPSMGHVARILERGLGRRRRVAFVTGATVLALAVGGAGLLAGRTDADGGSCARGGPDALDLTNVRSTLARQAGTELATRAVTKLEAWRETATVVREAGCRARDVDGALRVACIDRVDRETRVLVDALARANGTLATGALEAIDRVSDLSACTVARPVRSAVRESQTAEALRVELAALTVRDFGGEWALAERGALAIATRAGTDPALREVEAEAWRLVGQARISARRVPLAREAFEKSLVAAETAGNERLRSNIYFSLVGANLDTPHRTEARRWLAQASALLEKMGDTSQQWRIDMFSGVLEADPAKAVERLRAARDGYAKRGAEDQNTVTILGELSSALERAGQGEQALAFARRAVEVGERVLGPEHPALISPLQAVATLLAQQERVPEALVEARRSLDIAERRNGDVGIALIRLAFTLMSAGELAGAEALVTRATPLIDAHDGPRSALAGNVYMLRGLFRGQLNRHEEAIADFLHALDIQRAWESPESPSFIDLFEYLGRSQRALGRYDDAARSFSEAKAIRARQPDHKPVDDVAAETELGGTLVDAGRIDEGLPHLERALELSRTGTDVEAVAFAEHELAKALGARDRKRAIALLRAARATYRGLDAAERQRLAAFGAEVDALLAKLARR